MPRSTNAPDPPPEPTQSELMQAEVIRLKKLLGLDINRLAIGSDIEGIITGNNPFGPNDYTITGASVISFINVSTSIASSQTNAPGFPAQVTGLVVTPISNSQLNLAWTASGSPNITNYKVYRNSSSIASPVPNSYSDTGLTAGTTYAYNVSAVNSSALEGPLSVTVNGTTTGTAPILPSLELHFDSTYTDTSPNAFPTYTRFGLSNGFTTGQFGSSWQINTPSTPSGKEDLICGDPSTPELQMNTSVGFSFSSWFYPVDLTHAVGMRRFLVEKWDDASNEWSLSIDSAGILYFFVTKAGTTYKRQISGFTLNSWQHIGAVFNGATNTVEVYRNGVAGVASVAADVLSNTAGNNFHLGNRWVDPNSTYLEGRLDELRYYQRVLTSTQINNLKNTNAP